jgi:tetratricopeptide (TPR) repeat protein
MGADPAPPRRFFISHSSRDKEFALALADRLGEAWVDLHEIEIGDVLLDEVAAGIEAATDFVLLWTRNSEVSPWVRFEFHMAFIRHLEDNAIAIRILRLDDTDVPLPFRPFLQGRNVASPEEAAAQLGSDPPRRPTLRAFVNRNNEIDAIESGLYSAETGQVWLWGMTGVGKRAVARTALERVVADLTKVREVEVRAGTGFVELDLITSSALGTGPPPEELSEAEAEERSSRAIMAYAASGGIWTFAEAHHWLDEDGHPGRVLRMVLNALEAGGSHGLRHVAVFTTTRRPALDGAAARRSLVHPVRGLRSHYGVALLQAHGAQADESLLRQAAEELGGHPLALEIVARDLDAGTPDWEDFRATAATGVLAGLSLTTDTEALLERLAAVDGPLPAREYASHLGLDGERLQAAVEEGSAYSLIEQETGFLRLHPLLRDFYMRSFRRRDDFVAQAADLADRAQAQLDAATPGSAAYVDALMTAFRLLCWAGRVEDAMALHRHLFGTLYETAVELYNQRRYEDARRYFEIVIESTEDVRSARLYLARTLAYLGQVQRARDLVDGVLEQTPEDHHAWRVRGRIEFIAREFQRAIAFYERANEIRPGNPSVLRDLGQARMRVGDWHGARAALEAAMQRQTRDPDPFLAFQYSQVVEHFGEFETARRLITQAIRRDPRNVGFHHRLGRIAEALGDRETALREYEECLRLEPAYVESLVSLASLAVDSGDPDRATKYLEQARRTGNSRPPVLLNLEAKLHLREGNLDAARQSVAKALAEDREVPSIHLAARIELEAASAGVSRCSAISDTVRGFAEEIRLKGSATDADALLQKLAEICG